jgi:glycosyltransferase involved in cell wall biosynthesis
VVYSGRLDRAKGALDLPEIDRKLVRSGWEVRWTVFGAGPEAGALRQAFADCERVELAGALAPAEVAARLADHDVFVLPSRFEGLPLSLLEAMAAGLVPVCSDLRSGVRDVIDAGENGFLVPAGDSDGFAEAIAGLARDRILLERCSRAAAERVRVRFDASVRAHAFFDLLRDLCQSPHMPGRRLRRGPSRLDRRWLPNPLVRAIRRAVR